MRATGSGLDTRPIRRSGAQKQKHILARSDFAVDLDLEKLFDRIKHDTLMGLLAKRVADKRLLRLVRSLLTAGVVDGGLVGPTSKGTPQGRRVDAPAGRLAEGGRGIQRAGSGTGASRQACQIHPSRGGAVPLPRWPFARCPRRSPWRPG